MLRSGFVLTVVVMACGAIAAQATPTPVPGGANQVNAMSAKLGDTVFNGDLRIKVKELRDATTADHPERMLPTANQKVMVMSALIRNGLHRDFVDLLTYTLADADEVTFDIPSNYLTNANLHILQGASARQTAMFVVDKSFVPVKLIVRCATCASNDAFKTVRFTIPATTSAGP